MVAQIRQLSAYTVERLRSDVIVTSIAQAAEELVCNSIDAGATEIRVDIDTGRLFLRVEDDGCGVPAGSFGQLAKRHATSKFQGFKDLAQGLTTLGFRGEALASLCDVANVEITSKAKGAFETHTKLLQGGDVLKQGLALVQRTKQGTTVTVRDLFFNRPVRRKQISGIGMRKEIDNCRECLLRLALPRSDSVGFTLVDSMRQDSLLRLKRGPAEKTVLPLVFGQRLVQHGMCRQGQIQAALFICRPLEGFTSKSRQYMYVNGRYVANDAASKLLNTLFQQVLQDLQKRGCKQQGAARRFPAFVCYITCPPELPDVNLQPDKTAVRFQDWAPVLAAVRGLALQAWREFVPLGLFPVQSAVASAPAIQGPQRAAQPTTLESASSGVADAGGSAGEREGCRLRKRVRFSLDQEGAAGGASEDPDAGCHAPANHQHRRYSGVSPGGAELLHWPDMDETRFEPDWLQLEDRRVGRRHGCPAAHVEQPELEPGDLLVADAAEQWQPGLSRAQATLWQPQSPSEAALAARLPQSPALASPVGGASEAPTDSAATLAGSRGRQQRPQLHFRVRRRSCVHQRLKAAPEEQLPRSWPGQDQGLAGSDHTWELLEASGSDAAWMQAATAACGAIPAVCQEADRCASGKMHGMRSCAPGALCQQQQQQQQQQQDWHREQGDMSAGRDREAGRNDEEATKLKACKDNGPPAGRMRASSAPPHHRPRQRAAHTNPLLSLHSSGNSEATHQSAHSHCGLPGEFGLSHRVQQMDGELGQADSSAKPSAKRHVRRRLQTVSGVCSRLAVAAPFQKNLLHSAAHAPEPAADKQPRQSASAHSRGDNDTAEEDILKVQGLAMKSNGVASVAEVLAKSGQNGAAVAPSARNRLETLLDAPARRGRKPREAPPHSTADALTSILGGTSALGEAQTLSNSHPADRPPLQIQRAPLPDRAVDGGGAEGGEQGVAEGTADVAGAGRGGSITELLSGWTNPTCAPRQQQVLDLAALASGNLLGLVHATMTKAALDAARPLRQVDRKFVPLLSGCQLAIMDQHAADERVKLERLHSQVIGPGSTPVGMQSCELSPMQPLDLSPAELCALERFRGTLEAWGWRFELPPASSGASHSARLTHSATVLGTPLNGVELQSFLDQLEGSGGSAKVPPGVLRVLASKACHSAIRFGDVLDAQQCEELLSNLKATRGWHCCAHGRPTVAPLVDLAALQRLIELREHAS